MQQNLVKRIYLYLCEFTWTINQVDNAINKLKNTHGEDVVDGLICFLNHAEQNHMRYSVIVMTLAHDLRNALDENISPKCLGYLEKC